MKFQIGQVLRFGALGILSLGLANAGFIEDFELNANAGNVASLNNTHTTWAVTPTVDVVGPGYGSLTCHSGTSCIDLDGTGSQPAGGLNTSFSTVLGLTYTVNFWIGGSQRPFGGPDSVIVNFGTAAPVTINKPQGDSSWTLHTISFTAASTGTANLNFAGQGADNVGVLLDDVELSDNGVPEPATLGLIGAGLALIGLKRRK